MTLLLHQLRYEQRLFWRSREAAVFIFIFPLLLYALLGSVYGDEIDVVQLRARIGMVFQKPNPFPKSVWENVAYGPKIHGLARSRAALDEIVMSSLERAGLLGEVKDRLGDPGTSLSGGQQQRLCIARAIAVNPEVDANSCWWGIEYVFSESSQDVTTWQARIEGNPVHLTQ